MNNLKCLFFPLLLLKILSIKTREDDLCQENLNKYLSHKVYPNTNDTRSIFSQFYSFSDLNSGTNCASLIYNKTKFLEFIPLIPCVLSSSFKIMNLFTSQQIISIESVSLTILKGIDIHTSALTIPTRYFRKQTILQIFSSDLNFYSNDHLIDMLNECDLNTFNNTFNFLNSFYIVKFGNVVYPKVFCPLAFKGSNIAVIDFSDIINSFLITNRLNFYKLNQTQAIDSLTKSVKCVFLSVSYEILDEKILAESLFKYINRLVLHGVLYGIEEDMFREFLVLKNIDFQLDNIKEFFHSGLKWLSYINRDVRYSNETEIDYRLLAILRFLLIKNGVSFDPIYEYPNEDICLFKDFPHERLVFPLLVPGKQLSCTCLLKWLQSNRQFYIGSYFKFAF
jgi:hypothetical protein